MIHAPMLSHAVPKSQATLVAKVKRNLNNEDMRSELWQRIRAVRKVMNLNQTDFGGLFGVTKSSVSQWESRNFENRTTPELEKLQIMAEKSTAPLSWLLSDDSDLEDKWWILEKAYSQKRESITGQIYKEPKTIQMLDNPDYPAIRRVKFTLSAGASGFGVEYVDDDDDPIVFQKAWFDRHGYRPDKLFAVRVSNGSMEPSLRAGDTVVVNTLSTDPEDGTAFAVNYEGELVVKRLMRDAGQWWLTSDNPDKTRYPRKVCDERSVIIGRIVHRSTEVV